MCCSKKIICTARHVPMASKPGEASRCLLVKHIVNLIPSNSSANAKQSSSHAKHHKKIFRFMKVVCCLKQTMHKNASVDLRMETSHDYRHHCGVQLDLCRQRVRNSLCCSLVFLSSNYLGLSTLAFSITVLYHVLF